MSPIFLDIEVPELDRSFLIVVTSMKVKEDQGGSSIDIQWELTYESSCELTEMAMEFQTEEESSRYIKESKDFIGLAIQKFVLKQFEEFNE